MRSVAERAQAVRTLAKLGGDVNAQASDGSTPLHWAAGKGEVDGVRLLVALGADVHAQVHLVPQYLPWSRVE